MCEHAYEQDDCDVSGDVHGQPPNRQCTNVTNSRNDAVLSVSYIIAQLL
jgi:hypothetical protein